jgi:hypothetical protein
MLCSLILLGLGQRKDDRATLSRQLSGSETCGSERGDGMQLGRQLEKCCIGTRRKYIRIGARYGLDRASEEPLVHRHARHQRLHAVEASARDEQHFAWRDVRHPSHLTCACEPWKARHVRLRARDERRVVRERLRRDVQVFGRGRRVDAHTLMPDDWQITLSAHEPWAGGRTHFGRTGCGTGPYGLA